MKIEIKNLTDLSVHIIEGRSRNIFSSMGMDSALKEALVLIENLSINREFSEVVFNNEKFECKITADKESDREMVQIFYSLNFHTKDFLKYQQEEKQRQEDIKRMFSEVVKEYPKPETLYKEEKSKKKVSYYNKNRPF